MKKILFHSCLVILICNSSFAQNEVMKKKALSAMNSIKLQDYYKDATSELYNDYATLKNENADLKEEINSLEFQNSKTDSRVYY